MMREVFDVHGVPQVVHADRGTSMTSKTVADLLADLDVTRSHSRPKVSNDNPYREAWFKTLKYAPVFPDRFGSLADARAFMTDFVTWYNHDHRHTGIGLHTPADVHYGRRRHRPRRTARTPSTAARAAHPERFSTTRPTQDPRPARHSLDQPTRAAEPTSRLTPAGLNPLTNSARAARRFEGWPS